jgi:hypothetical protein
MSELYNMYCDESCHLEHDQQKAMVLGTIWCPQEHVKSIIGDIREIKEKHGFHQQFEIKWVKVSPKMVQFYLDLVDYFFSNNELHFRALIIPDKSILQHAKFNQTHDDWYYKMYFDMLKVIVDPGAHYNIYLDIKDTRGGSKIKKLREVLSNANYDFSRTIIHTIQIIRSHEVNLLQLADLLIGATAYANRDLNTSMAKFAVVTRLRNRSGYSLRQSTLLAEKKCNLFVWHPKENSF